MKIKPDHNATEPGHRAAVSALAQPIIQMTAKKNPLAAQKFAKLIAAETLSTQINPHEAHA
jgi:hypothetical protein